jgi:hypothetical protein
MIVLPRIEELFASILAFRLARSDKCFILGPIASDTEP